MPSNAQGLPKFGQLIARPTLFKDLHLKSHLAYGTKLHAHGRAEVPL